MEEKNNYLTKKSFKYNSQKKNKKFKNENLQNDNFIKQQIKFHSILRIKEGREKPIDNIINFLLIFFGEEYTYKIEKFENKIKNPILIFQNLKKEDLKSILEDIPKFINILDFPKINIFWKNIKILINILLEEKITKKILTIDKEKKINEIIKNKKLKDLKILNSKVDEMINGVQFIIDMDYWDFLQTKIRKEICLIILKNYFKENSKLKKNNNFEKKVEKKKIFIEEDFEEVKMVKRLDKEVSFMKQKDYENYLFLKRKKILESFTRKYLDRIIDDRIKDENEKNIFIEKKMEIIKKFKEDRNEENKCEDFNTEYENNDNISNKQEEKNNKKKYEENIYEDFNNEYKNNDNTTHKEKNLEINNNKKNEENKYEDFNTEYEKNDNTTDKDKNMKEINNKNKKHKKNLNLLINTLNPRKPHFFNRVKLGYEWNKINQLHYNLEKPPPRQVMGYRFNIFYPNLYKKDFIPSYKLIPLKNPEECIIEFCAGIPYENLRFRIVNKKWNMADRKNFKCIFEDGILHLFFDFETNVFKR